MSILKGVNSGGDLGDLNIVGTDRNTDIGLFVHVPEGETVKIGILDIRNVFIPLIKTGKGRLEIDKLRCTEYGGDLSNLRAGNIFIRRLFARHNTPTRPYKTCVRLFQETIDNCLRRHNETVWDSSLLSFENFQGQQVIKGYHVDGGGQIYAVKDDGYTVDNSGTINNITIEEVDIVLNGSRTQGFMGSERCRYTHIHIGKKYYSVIMDGYPYHAVFNQLDNSTIGNSSGDVGNSKVRIEAVKPTVHKSYNNTIMGIEHKPKEENKMSESSIRMESNQIQRYLSWIGLYGGNIDGIIGTKTNAAIAEFQAKEDTDEFSAKLIEKVETFSVPDWTDKEGLAHAVKHVCDHMYHDNLVYPAYVMATVQHETAGTYRPIEEAGHIKSYETAQRIRKKLRYAPYWGRGYVQLTHKYNYQKYTNILGLDLLSNPDLVMEKDLSLFILVHGMVLGMFTNHKMRQFVLGDNVDVIQMRSVVNGIPRGHTLPDKAELIAKHYEKHLAWYKEVY